VPLTALGISTVIIGLTCFALGSTRPDISPEACQMILKTGMENTAALLEELGLRNRAIYLPSAMRDGNPRALVPLVGDIDLQRMKKSLPGRLLVHYGTSPEDMAIAVATPGSINVDMLETRPGPTADEISAAITYILSGLLDIADAVSVERTDKQVQVEVRGAKLGYEDIWYYRCLGSPIASIAAAVTSEALEKAVRISEENHQRGKTKIVLEVLS